MIIKLPYEDYIIKVFDDSAYTNNADSATTYENIYQPESDKEYRPVSPTAVVVYKNEVKIFSAILLAVAGATSVTEDAAVIDNNNVIARTCNTVFSLKLPELSLNWMTVADPATCFSIHKYKDTFITHGEMSVSRLDRNGNILWQHGGADIFVTLYDGEPFEMHDTYIALTDFSGSKYKIDYDGNSLEYEKQNYMKQKLAIFYKKPWWKFW